jgi:hypothetical protein
MKRRSGKRIVYISQYKNLAIEIMKEYQRKGFDVEIKAENDKTGSRIYVVYVYH